MCYAMLYVVCEQCDFEFSGSLLGKNIAIATLESWGFKTDTTWEYLRVKKQSWIHAKLYSLGVYNS